LLQTGVEQAVDLSCNFFPHRVAMVVRIFVVEFLCFHGPVQNIHDFSYPLR
jgi:hypothetical protein